MKTIDQNRRDRKSGVALVIVLGLLSVLTTLAVAFAIAMRVEHSAAQHFANAVRAEHLAQAGIARAMEAVQTSMTNPLSLTYPRWYDSSGSRVEAKVSTGPASSVKCPDLLSGEAAAAIPGFIQDISGNIVRDECKWTNIVDAVGGRTNRIAYAVFNNSGLLDANYIGGAKRVWSESLREIDIHMTPGIANPAQFYSNRTDDVRYETLPELLALQDPTGLNRSATRDLFVYSYDPGRDEGFTNEAVKLAKLGSATTNDLKLKFNVNALTNMSPKTYLTNPDFAIYTNKLIHILNDAGLTFKPEDVLWNIVNWIDNDRYPQNGYDPNPAIRTSPRPSYLSTEGGEALPEINEIVLEKVVAGTATNCQFAVEVWYPFVVENEDWGTGSASYKLIIDTIPPSGATTNLIPPMAYGTPTEFRFFRSNVMPGSSAQVRAIVIDQDGRPVDAAMDRHDGNWAVDDWTNWVLYTTFSDFHSMEVDDPRSNGKPVYWVQCKTTNTLGKMNSISDPWGDQWNPPPPTPPNFYDRQGLPIYVKNGPMENIGEMGYIPLANRENHVPALPPIKHYWCTIDLLCTNQGAHLLDYMTVYPTNRSGHGYVTVNTRDESTLKALFTEMKIGWRNGAIDHYVPIHVEDSDCDRLVSAVVGAINARTDDPAYPHGAINFADLFDDVDATPPGGPVAKAFRDFGAWWAGKTGLRDNDKVREDTFRNIIELISFRQNIFSIVVAAQVMAPNGRTVEAEKRALATVYRDSYTGNYFVRSFKWLK